MQAVCHDGVLGVAGVWTPLGTRVREAWRAAAAYAELAEVVRARDAALASPGVAACTVSSSCSSSQLTAHAGLSTSPHAALVSGRYPLAVVKHD